MRWFTSDLHLGHARICELANRPFASVEEMNGELVRRWNAVVKPSDKVYVLGDFAMGQLADSLPIGQQLNGSKLLVYGNHDRPFWYDRENADPRTLSKRAEWVQRYKQEGGFLIVRRAWMAMLEVAGQPVRVRMNHFPYTGDSQVEDRYLTDRPLDTGDWLLHGHTHSHERVRGRQIHVGVDAWDYTPVPESEIVSIIRRLP